MEFLFKGKIVLLYMADRFSCDRCGYSTNTIKCMKNHLNRKSICSPLLSNVSVDEIRTKLFEQKKEYVCEKCDKSFSYRSGKSRHSKTCNQPVKDPIHIHGNTTINITQNNIIQNIVINNYGSEAAILSENEFKAIISKLPYAGIISLIKYKHFNPEKPESMNFFISNLGDNIGRIYRKPDWKVISGKKLVDDVLKKWNNAVHLMIDDLEQEAKKKEINLHDSLKTQIEKWDVDIYETDIRKRLREIFYDSRSLVKKTHHIS